MSQQASATPSAKEGKHILGWIFGILLLVLSLLYVLLSVTAGLLTAIAGLLVLPPTRKQLETWVHRTLSPLILIGAPILLFIISMAVLVRSTPSTRTNSATSNTNTPVAVTNINIPTTDAQVTNTATTVVANTNQAVPTTNTSQNINQPEPTPVVVEPVKEEPKPEPTTLDKLWIALDDSIKTRTGYDVQWDEVTKTAWLTRTQDTFWDEKDLVEDTYTDFVKFGKLAFQIDGVEYIDISYQVPFTDEFGAEAMKDAVGLQMKKETFEKFNWENLKYQPIYQTMQDNAEYQNIHPSIRKKIDESKLILSF